MSELPLFVYGTLLLPEVVELVCGVRLKSQPASLDGYRRHALRNRVYPAIVPCAGARVEGGLVAGLGTRERDRIDAFEGDLYQRLEVTVAPIGVGAGVGAGAEGPSRALAYVLHPGRASLVLDHGWEVDAFEREHGLAYLERCREFAVHGTW